jgi:uncharacterized tellurite resistance protein B-like protein
MTLVELAEKLNPAEIAIVLAATVVQADGKVHPAEREILEAMVDGFRKVNADLVRNAETSVVVEFALRLGEAAKVDVEQFAKVLTKDLTADQKRWILLNTLLIAKVDGHGARSEAETITMVFEGMGLTRADLDQVTKEIEKLGV